MNHCKTYILSFLIAFTLLYASDSKAQFTLTPSATLVKYQILNSLSYDTIHIANNSSDTLKLKWELIQYDTLGGSYLDFCSSGNCWLGFPDSGSFPPIVPGGFGWAGAHFWTGNIPVSCTARILLYEEGAYAAGDTLTYILHTINENSIEDNVATEHLFEVYPNPATEKITIKSASATPEEISVTICNMLGEIIIDTHTKAAVTEIPLEGFCKGIYFVNISSGNGKFVKKIVVSK